MRLIHSLMTLTLLTFTLSNTALAANGVGLLNDSNWNQLAKPGLLIAQLDADETYDPFADYSEFEESSEEEADINFFRNGRFFTLGFIGGYRSMTEGLGDIYDDTFAFGVFLSYFFDLRFALQMSFITGDHQLNFTSPGGTAVNGNVSLTQFAFNLKYYLNTQNVTRGLAKLNPYIIGGFSQVYRTATTTGTTSFSKEGAVSFDVGAGIEIPLMRKKMFFGGELTYHLINFQDENTEIVVNGTERTGLFPTGDSLTLMGVLGVNF